MEELKKEFESWEQFIDHSNLSIEYDIMLSKIDLLYENNECFPEKSKIFRAFRETTYDNCSCVLLGMDPYPGVYKGVPSACGLSFATENGYINPSLRIIFENLIEDGLKNQKDNLSGTELINWAKQGMLLLNTALTIQKGISGSHLKVWKEWTEIFITSLSKKRPDIIWVLLGNDAKKFKNCIISENIIEAPHPMTNIYQSPNKPFSNEHVFLELNKKLKRKIIFNE